MAAARRIDLETQSFRDGGWQVGLGRDLNGATLGIIGLGRRGSLVAGYGRAFGLNANVWSQHLIAGKEAAKGVTDVRQEAVGPETGREGRSGCETGRAWDDVGAVKKK